MGTADGLDLSCSARENAHQLPKEDGKKIDKAVPQSRESSSRRRSNSASGSRSDGDRVSSCPGRGCGAIYIDAVRGALSAMYVCRRGDAMKRGRERCFQALQHPGQHHVGAWAGTARGS